MIMITNHVISKNERFARLQIIILVNDIFKHDVSVNNMCPFNVAIASTLSYLHAEPAATVPLLKGTCRNRLQP